MHSDATEIWTAQLYPYPALYVHSGVPGLKNPHWVWRIQCSTRDPLPVVCPPPRIPCQAADTPLTCKLWGAKPETALPLYLGEFGGANPTAPGIAPEIMPGFLAAQCAASPQMQPSKEVQNTEGSPDAEDGSPQQQPHTPGLKRPLQLDWGEPLKDFDAADSSREATPEFPPSQREASPHTQAMKRARKTGGPRSLAEQIRRDVMPDYLAAQRRAAPPPQQPWTAEKQAAY